MDEQGVPISIECFPGNTLDHQTLATSFRNSVDSVTARDSRFVYVCDKGIGKGVSRRAVLGVLLPRRPFHIQKYEKKKARPMATTMPNLVHRVRLDGT